VPIRTGRGGCCPASVSRDPSENGRSFAHTLSTPLAALWLLKIRNSKLNEAANGGGLIILQNNTELLRHEVRRHYCVSTTFVIPASYADDGESLSRFFLCFR
jgi:hypothetical protein